MEERFDKIGRRIPQFDRKAAAAKAQKTREEKYGSDYNSRIGRLGASVGTSGYFGKLKATNPEKLKEISKAASQKSASRTAAERHKSAQKGWETRNRLQGADGEVRK